jgi:hypothetical protein
LKPFLILCIKAMHSLICKSNIGMYCQPEGKGPEVLHLALLEVLEQVQWGLWPQELLLVDGLQKVATLLPLGCPANKTSITTARK